MATDYLKTRNIVIFVIHGHQGINMQSFEKIWDIPFLADFDAYREWLLILYLIMN